MASFKSLMWRPRIERAARSDSPEKVRAQAQALLDKR